VSRRLSLTEEGIQILRHCFTGERFSFRGKRYQIDDAQVTPGYVQEGGPPLWLAITAAQSAARAAKYDAHILPQGGREKTIDPYRAESEAAGNDPNKRRVGIIRGCFPTPDPERDEPKVTKAETYRMQFYARLAVEAKRNIWEGEDVIPQGYIIGSVDECVASLVEFMRRYGITDVVTWGLPPGMTFDEIAPSLESFAVEVVPRVREELLGGPGA
jgi:alkanesulfonate monooxygenase SsuD/methylene tetrahydromethanopterin reductase-like flavin-dependent oxidoreductase (luciferase family)